MNTRKKQCGSRFLAVLISIALSQLVTAQPIIEGEDIIEASDELRDLLYERFELQQRLKELQVESERVENELKSVEQFVTMQKKLDALWAQIEIAEEQDNESVVKTLEEVADKLEQLIAHRQELRELDAWAFEVSELAERVREEDKDDDVKRVADRLNDAAETIKKLREVMAKLHQIRHDGPQKEVAALEKLADELRRQTETDDELIELVGQVFDAMEEDDDERVEELFQQVQQLVSPESPPDAEEPVQIDSSHLPIPVTEESLARYDGAGFQNEVVPLLNTYCIECHGNDSSSGELNIEKMITQRPLVINREQWINVIEQAKNRVMPPEDATQPNEEERAELVLTLHKAIYDFDYSQIKDPGFESARRLTHQEYDNTIRDLFGVELRRAQEFPSDLAGRSGFNNSANTLFMQPLLMERYMGAADDVVAALLPDHPETDQQKKVYASVFFTRARTPNDEPRVAKAVLGRFLSRAFRRPLTNKELDRVESQYAHARAQGLGHDESIKGMIRTALISPNFLLKAESRPDSDGEHRINEWELASRLSYFIWASMPDQELFDLAAASQLHNPEVLKKQVDRMINDPKSETLGTIFAAQWLGSQHLGTRMRLDPIDNPWCTESLMEAMRNETAMFFHTLIIDNEPISRLIDADFTFLNSELAKLYKISGIRGEQMRRVQLDTDKRGGILGHGSLLAVTSFPYRTSPVVRGKWVLDTVLGTPPPPPPPNVSEFPEEIAENERLSIRQKLEMHRKAPNCYACHSQMDPLGLSMENYDWFGRWRERYGRRRIDVSGTLPDGTEFEGLAGLKRVLVEQRSPELVRQVATKMLSYGLGRQLEYYDEPALRTIIANVKKDGSRFRSLIHEVVASYPFQYKKNRNNKLASALGE